MRLLVLVMLLLLLVLLVLPVLKELQQLLDAAPLSAFAQKQKKNGAKQMFFF